MKNLLLVLLLFPLILSAQSKIKVYITTGSDDLRSGNHAYLTINYMDGSASQEFSLGGGFQRNSLVTVMLSLDKIVEDNSSIKNITIRHDGSPRAGQPFDTYDPWDLQALRVTLISQANDTEQNVVHERGNPLMRFLPSLRSKVFTPIQSTTRPSTTSEGTPIANSSSLKVYITTGSDDLRSGNHAYLTVNYADGTASQEFSLGNGFRQNSIVTLKFHLNKIVEDNASIKNITIRHDGSPRAGQPFDTYDPWDLQALRVALISKPNAVERNLINERGNPLMRFVPSLRSKIFIAR